MARPKKLPVIEPEDNEDEEQEEQEETPKRKVYKGGSVITLTDNAFNRLIDSFTREEQSDDNRRAKSAKRPTTEETDDDTERDTDTGGKPDKREQKRPNRKHWLFG